MRIVNVDETTKPLFCQCLEDWNDDVREAGDRRCRWVDRFTPRGLRAKIALDDAGTPGGMIQYLPIEQSTADGTGLYFIPCICVHGHKQGRGNFQGRGMGRALLAAAEEDARALGAKGMAAWGLWLPFWMKASWFKKHGYRSVARDGIASLLWKPFVPDAQPPRVFRRTAKPLELTPGRVNVTCFVNGWCTSGNLTAERARRVAGELGETVVFREVDTSEHAAVAEWGLVDALFVDGKQVMTGPPIRPRGSARSSGRRWPGSRDADEEDAAARVHPPAAETRRSRNADRDSNRPKDRSGFGTLQSTEIYLARLDGSALRRVTNGGAFAGSPSWSPDGTKLVFYEAALPEVDLIKSPLSPRATTQLASVDVRTASVKP